MSELTMPARARARAGANVTSILQANMTRDVIISAFAEFILLRETGGWGLEPEAEM
jgi:hypothetical protein